MLPNSLTQSTIMLLSFGNRAPTLLLSYYSAWDPPLTQGLRMRSHSGELWRLTLHGLTVCGGHIVLWGSLKGKSTITAWKPFS
jgi:hypothetical protein